MSFDAVLFFTGGDLGMDAQQKADFLSFIHDDGKGFIGVHSATITFTDWPEYGEMIGGYFDEHPWGTFDAPILVEDPSFPGMQQWPRSFVLRDEIYQIRNYSREKVRVLMRLDAGRSTSKNPRVHRTDRDFAVTWAKMYGKGRVYYSTLGHPKENWDNPDLQKMYIEAIKWATGLVDADVTPRPLPDNGRESDSEDRNKTHDHQTKFREVNRRRIASAAAPLAASGKLNIGVGTYSYHSLSIDDMIAQLNALRIREIEMSRGEFMLIQQARRPVVPLHTGQIRQGGHPLRFVLHGYHQGRERPRERGTLRKAAGRPKRHRRRGRRAYLPWSISASRERG